MDNPNYVTLSRQSGLMKAMQAVANNIANMSTGGFRREGVVFAERLERMEALPDTLAMTDARVRHTSTEQGALRATGGTYDLAIEGPGFFQVETADGPRLTRAGAFTRSATGELVTMGGAPVLDSGGAPVLLPPDASAISIAGDGTVDVDGQPIAQIGLWEVADASALARQDGVLFQTDDALEPAAGSQIVQGSLEGSNVDPIAEMTRMIEIQRAYELGQKFLEREDERIRGVIRTMGQTA
ncbi:MAG: flagellar hook-basal body complex protein [Pseudomonadota bacterium]